MKIILACCCLHNYLIANRDDSYYLRNFADHFNDEGELIEGEWRGNQFGWQVLDHSHARESEQAKAIRNELKDYVNSSVGAVPWQHNLDTY